MNRFCTSVFIFLISTSAFSVGLDEPLEISRKKLSDLNRRARFPFGFNAYGFGPIGGAAITADYFITPKIALEAGAGFRDFDFNHGFTVGARYHVFGKTMLNMTPYIGLYTAFHYNGSDLQNNSLYIPAGIHKIKKNGFSWSVEVAWQRNTFFDNGFSGGFRIGYRFKTKQRSS
jgi:hypothetical protein